MRHRNYSGLAKYILGILLLCVTWTLPVYGQKTTLGQETNDVVKLVFYNQNDNASNTVYALNLYSPLAFNNSLIPAILSGKTFDGPFVLTNNAIFKYYDSGASAWQEFDFRVTNNVPWSTNSVSRIGRTETLQNKTIASPTITGTMQADTINATNITVTNLVADTITYRTNTTLSQVFTNVTTGDLSATNAINAANVTVTNNLKVVSLGNSGIPKITPGGLLSSGAGITLMAAATGTNKGKYIESNPVSGDIQYSALSPTNFVNSLLTNYAEPIITAGTTNDFVDGTKALQNLTNRVDSHATWKNNLLLNPFRKQVLNGYAAISSGGSQNSNNIALGQNSRNIWASGNYDAFPGLVLLPNGHLWCVFRRASAHISTDGTWVQMISTNMGQTWSVPTTFYTIGAGYDMRDVEAVLLNSGKILVTGFATETATTNINSYSALCTVSGGVVTMGSLSTNASSFTDYDATPARALELANGEILLPIYGRNSGESYATAAVLKSTDNGATFTNQVTMLLGGTQVGGVTYIGDATEAGMVQFSNGRIVTLIRCEGLGYVRMYSDDNGATWPNFTNVVVTAAVGKPDMLVLASGGLYLNARNTMTSQLFATSWDQGATWTTNEYKTGGFCVYSSSVLLGGGCIASVLCQELTYDTTQLIFYDFYDGFGLFPSGIMAQQKVLIGTNVSIGTGALQIKGNISLFDDTTISSTNGSITLVAGNNNSNIIFNTSGTGKVGVRTETPDTGFTISQPAAYVVPTLGTASGGFSLVSADKLYGLYAGVVGDGTVWLQAMRNDAATAYDIKLNPSGGDVVIPDLRIVDGAYSGNLVFGSTPAWASGIRVYDNGNAEMRIWHANAAGKIILATGYDGDNSTVLPSGGIWIISNKMGIGVEPSTYFLDVNGSVRFATNLTGIAKLVDGVLDVQNAQWPESSITNLQAYALQSNVTIISNNVTTVEGNLTTVSNTVQSHISNVTDAHNINTNYFALTNHSVITTVTAKSNDWNTAYSHSQITDGSNPHNTTNVLWATTATNVLNVPSHTLNQHSGVNITSEVENQVLYYDGIGNWLNGTIQTNWITGLPEQIQSRAATNHSHAFVTGSGTVNTLAMFSSTTTNLASVPITYNTPYAGYIDHVAYEHNFGDSRYTTRLAITSTATHSAITSGTNYIGTFQPLDLNVSLLNVNGSLMIGTGYGNNTYFASDGTAYVGSSLRIGSKSADAGDNNLLVDGSTQSGDYKDHNGTSGADGSAFGLTISDGLVTGISTPAGISTSQQVIIPGNTTNLLVWTSGILVSNIANYYSP